MPGGNFVADFTIFHRFNSGPQTIIGFPHPNDPPATFPKGNKKHATESHATKSHATKSHALKAKATSPITINKPGMASLAATNWGLIQG